MRNIVALMLLYFMRFTLWFRYRVNIKGEEYLNLKTLNKPGGVLFLPNHPTVFVDPTLVALAVWKKYPIRPMIVEYMYYTPIVNWFMRFMKALPIPNFGTSTNSLKKRKADKVVDTVIEGLKQKDNFLIYPAGRVKFQAKEVIGGSAVPKIINAVPEANIVLIRITGLWGSSFSRALTGTAVPMFATIFEGIKIALKNLIFFTPRRQITIQFTPAPADFPYQGSRLEINQYLERFYNRPDGITKQSGDQPGESLSLVSYSMWKEELPKIKTVMEEEGIDLAKIPESVQAKVKKQLSEMAHISVDQIKPEQQLGSDLGLDSLDIAELIAFLDDSYDLAGISSGELSTVGKVMAIASKQVTCSTQEEEEQQDISKWFQAFSQEQVQLETGETIPEVFLNLCDKRGNEVLCGDMRAGVLTYAQAKMRVILLAEYIRKLPGEYIGIVLPSSVAAYLTILAIQLAGKVPLMINWTVGPKHLETVIALSKVQVVLSSWTFLDKLDSVDFNGLDEAILTLEDVRREFTLKDKLQAWIRSKQKADTILKTFGIRGRSTTSNAVLLFTSGTESMPKGVVLSHENILSNQRAALQTVKIHRNDVLLGILPPFHSFGFTVSGLLPLLAGIRVAYYPDPTNGKGIAKEVERWGVTLICGAPTFLKNMFRDGKLEQLKTLRLLVTGAEKAPPELFEKVRRLAILQGGEFFRNSLERGKTGSKRSDPNEELMVKAMGDEEDRSGEAAAEKISKKTTALQYNCKLVEGYGITECSPILTVNITGEAKYGIGKPLENVTLNIVNLDTYEPLPQGESGLILARGPSVFAGYLNLGLASPFVSLKGEQWYSTGDLGYFDNQGHLLLSGRLKRFIKMGGEMISLGGVEEALQKLEAGQAGEGAHLAVCAKEIAGEKTRIFVFTTFPSSVEEMNKTLREAGFSNLVKVSKTMQLEGIPLMGTGKVNYRALETYIPTLIESSEASPVVS